MTDPKRLRKLAGELHTLRQFVEQADGTMALIHADEFDDLEPAAQALRDYAELVEGLNGLAKRLKKEADKAASIARNEGDARALGSADALEDTATALRQLLASKP